MDFEATADHLRQLGCNEEQIQRHLEPLRIHADKRARAKPKQIEQPPHKHWRRPTFQLTQDQIDRLLPKLRARNDWRWVSRPGVADKGAWVGHAVLAVTGAPQPVSNAEYLVADALGQLQEAGLIRKVRVQDQCRPRVYKVQLEVLAQPAKPQRLPRERFEDAELPQRVALTGRSAPGHAAIEGQAACHV
jgi:hypothetical protein